MRKNREVCHVCDFIMNTLNGKIPNVCGLCYTSLHDRSEEVRVMHTTTSNEAGGIKAYEVHVIITNKRIIFTGDEEYEGTIEILGWIFGGLIGGLVGGAVEEEMSNNTRQVSVKFDDISSLDVQQEKKTKSFAIRDKQGNTFFFKPHANDADRLEIAIKNRLAHIPHANFQQ